jgi:hypothetical protein
LLQEMILCIEEPDLSNSCEHAEGNELTYRLLTRLRMGGSLCKFGDNTFTTLEGVKRVYKSLQSV